ncbi:MAG: lysostaphin resistance A-like protein [Thermoanaerobaculia bacterium]
MTVEDFYLSPLLDRFREFLGHVIIAPFLDEVEHPALAHALSVNLTALVFRVSNLLLCVLLLAIVPRASPHLGAEPRSPVLRQVVVLLLTVWLLECGFSILATPLVWGLVTNHGCPSWLLAWSDSAVYLAASSVPVLLLFRWQRRYSITGPAARSFRWVGTVICVLAAAAVLVRVTDLMRNSFVDVDLGGQVGGRVQPELGSGVSWVPVAAYYLAIAVIEELIFRGGVYDLGKARMGAAFGAVWSGYLFAVSHVPPLWLGVKFFLLSLCAAWLVERFRSLGPAIAFHFVWNLLVQSSS